MSYERPIASHRAPTPSRKKDDGKIGRRSALRLAGTGGLLAAGGGALGAYAERTFGGGGDMANAAAVADLNFAGGKTAADLTVPSIPPSGRRPKYRRATWSEQFQGKHGWSIGGSGTASSERYDTERFIRGTQSLRVTTAGNGKQSYVRKTGLDPQNLTGKMIRLIFRVDDTAKLSKLVFYLGSQGLANNFVWQYHIHSAKAANYVQSGEWVTVHLQWSDVRGAAGAFSVSRDGVPSTTTGFTDMSFAAYDSGGGPVTYNLQAIEAVPDTSAVFPKGVVSITFDDSHHSVHGLGRPTMDAYGFPGTIYNIADAIGTNGFLTIDQMRSMQNFSGWEMAGHAYANDAHTASYEKLSAEQVDDDLRKLREWLVSNGFTSEHFAYPHGSFQKTTDGVPVDLLASRHFTTARSIISETIESFAPAMPYRLKSLTGITDGEGVGGTQLDQLTGVGGRLDRCAKNGDWLILCLHRITDGPPKSSTEISREGLAALMKEIDDRGMPVVTVEEAMTYYR
ncbi:polysaccharide deacetylase family protein [Streptomyces boninensis]|uniref:polysaccharide deacetylase family protein n=1 Tax=Streptomyces boninensis TaxID=2039455 RepID=UPI003B218B3C